MRPTRVPAQPVGGKSGGGGCSRGRDDRALEYGKGIPGVVAIEHEYGRGARKTALDVGGITGDPFQSRHVEAVSEVGRKRDDPAIGLLGKPQEVAVRIDGPSIRMREIRAPDDPDAVIPVGVDDVEHGLAVDDGELEVHGFPYSSLVAHAASNTVSR